MDQGHDQDVAIDQRAALEAAVDRLTVEFGARYDADEIEYRLRHTYREFAATAKLRDFLPLMAERTVRDRLHDEMACAEA